MTTTTAYMGLLGVIGAGQGNISIKSLSAFAPADVHR